MAPIKQYVVINIAEVNPVGNPDVGFLWLFPKDGKMWVRNSSGVEYALSGVVPAGSTSIPVWLPTIPMIYIGDYYLFEDRLYRALLESGSFLQRQPDIYLGTHWELIDFNELTHPQNTDFKLADYETLFDGGNAAAVTLWDMRNLSGYNKIRLEAAIGQTLARYTIQTGQAVTHEFYTYVPTDATWNAEFVTDIYQNVGTDKLTLTPGDWAKWKQVNNITQLLATNVAIHYQNTDLKIGLKPVYIESNGPLIDFTTGTFATLFQASNFFGIDPATPITERPYSIKTGTYDQEFYVLYNGMTGSIIFENDANQEIGDSPLILGPGDWVKFKGAFGTPFSAGKTQFITSNRLVGIDPANTEEGLALDQTVPQTVENGKPIFAEGIESPEIKTDGTTPTDLTITTGADKTIELQTSVWDDLRITPGSFDRPGTSDPTIQSVQPGGSGTATFIYRFEKNNIASFAVQLPHSYKIGTDIYCHAHWTPGARGVTEDGATVGWKLDYTWASINTNFGVMATLDLSDACDGVDWKHQMTPDVVISGADKGISSMLICNIKRTDTGTDDTWAGATTNSPFLLEIDFHFEIDTIGSRQKAAK